MQKQIMEILNNKITPWGMSSQVLPSTVYIEISKTTPESLKFQSVFDACMGLHDVRGLTDYEGILFDAISCNSCAAETLDYIGCL